MYNSCQDKREIEAKKWDTIDNKASRAHGEGYCWRRPHDASTKLRCDHNKDSDPIAERIKILLDLAMVSSGSNNPQAKKCTFPKMAPGSVTCANNNIKTTLTVIRMKRPFKTNLNRLSCSIWLNSVGWRKVDERNSLGRALSPWTTRSFWWCWDWTRLPIQIKLSFKATTTRGGGSPKAWTQKMAVQWKF